MNFESSRNTMLRMEGNEYTLVFHGKIRSSYLESLTDSLLRHAILQPQINEISYFLKPSIEKLGVQIVSRKLIALYHQGDFLEKVGVLRTFGSGIVYANAYFDFYDPQRHIKEHDAHASNGAEYRERERLLRPEIRKCNDPVLLYLFKDVIIGCSGDMVGKNIPASLSDLLTYVESSPEYKDQLDRLMQLLTGRRTVNFN